jgi:hypothetical protein
MHDLLVRILGRVEAEDDPREGKGVYEHGNIGSKECLHLRVRIKENLYNRTGMKDAILVHALIDR